MHCSFEPLVTLPPFSCVASWRRSVGPLREKKGGQEPRPEEGERRRRADGRSVRLSRLGGGNSFGSGGGGGTSIARPNQTLTHSLRKSASVGGRSFGQSASVTGAASALLIAASGATAIVANEGQSMRLARCSRRRRRHSSAAPLPPSFQPTSREPRLAGWPVGRSVGRSNGLGTK